MSEMNIATFCKRFLNGDFDDSDRMMQIEAGWFDWFCQDSALANKTEFLGKKVVEIADSKKFDKDKCYVFFKNNCPCVGPLYDQFSICDIKTGDVLFCCQHLEKGSHGCDHAHWEVYNVKRGLQRPVARGSWDDVLKYFNK